VRAAETVSICKTIINVHDKSDQTKVLPQPAGPVKNVSSGLPFGDNRRDITYVVKVHAVRHLTFTSNYKSRYKNIRI